MCQSKNFRLVSILPIFEIRSRSYFESHFQPIAPVATQQFDEIRIRYKCPIFYGLVICCSNLDSTQKERIAKAITKNGGAYQTALDRNKCTHLIVGSPGGKKHKYAKQWGFTIVNSQWIDDSVKKGFAQLHSLDKYKVESYDETMSEVSFCSKFVP